MGTASGLAAISAPPSATLANRLTNSGIGQLKCRAVVRLEWGERCLEAILPHCTVIVVVGVLRFTRAVDVAVSRGQRSNRLGGSRQAMAPGSRRLRCWPFVLGSASVSIPPKEGFCQRPPRRAAGQSTRHVRATAPQWLRPLKATVRLAWCPPESDCQTGPSALQSKTCSARVRWQPQSVRSLPT